MIPLTDSASKPVGKQSFIPSRSFAEKAENAQPAQAARFAFVGKAVKREKQVRSPVPPLACRHSLSRDVGTTRDQERLFIGEVEDLKAESVNYHTVIRVDKVKTVDHSFTAEPGGVFHIVPL